MQELRLNPTAQGEERILARLKISSDVEIFKDGSEVKVTPFSPLGGRIIEIKRGYDSPRGKYQSQEAQDEAQANVKKADRKYDWIQGSAEGELLQTLNSLVDENRPGIARIVSNLAIVSERLTRTDNVIGALINDETTGLRFKEMTEHLNEISSDVADIIHRMQRGKGLAGEILSDKPNPLHDNVNAAAFYASGALQEANLMLRNANEGRSALGVFVSENKDATRDTRNIVHDISTVTSDIATGTGSLGMFVKDPRFYEGAATTAENLGKITDNMTSSDPTKQSAVGVLLNDPETGARVRSTLAHLEAISRSVDQGDGALGLVVNNHEFRDRVSRIFTEVERLTVEFRDSVEDLREQAPVNAFLGAVFAAF